MTMELRRRENRDLWYGISIFPWTKTNLSFIGKLKWFVMIVCIAIVMQGTAQTYFNRTMHVWKEHYQFNEQTAEWLIVSNNIAQGVLALFVIHASVKFNRIKWIAGTLALFAVTCFCLIIPEWVHPLHNEESATLKDEFESRQFCHLTRNETVLFRTEDPCWTTFTIMFIFQTVLGASIVCLSINSLLYVDDHETLNNSVILIGTILGFKELGSYVGVYFSWITKSVQGGHVFGTGSWICIIALLLICSAMIAMFPVYLFDFARVKTCVFSAEVNQETGLRKILGRLLGNKTVILNILSFTFLCAAMGNFSLVENKFIQSKFIVNDQVVFHGTWITQIVTSLLKPLIVFLIVIAMAFFISKLNIRAFTLGIWNGMAPLIVVLIFLAYLGLGCNKIFISEIRSKLINPYCSYDCNCEQSLFDPVCLEFNQKTYFSPCHAGCTDYNIVRGVKVYTNCSCGEYSFAKEGGCLENHCQQDWVVMEIFRVTTAVIIASILVGHTLINVYCVHYTDRAYILALESAVVGLIAYIPIRFIYLELAGRTCQYFGKNNIDCSVYDGSTLSRNMIAITVSLLVLSSLLALATAFSVKNLDLDKNYFLHDYPATRVPIPLNNQLNEEYHAMAANQNEDGMPKLEDEIAENEENAHAAENNLWVIQADVHNQEQLQEIVPDINDNTREMSRDRIVNFETSF